MRTEPNRKIDILRQVHPSLGASPQGANFGYFVSGKLRIISSGSDADSGWEHVSISCEARIPGWEEMNRIKNLFWKDDETVVQFHPKKSKYVNHHPYTLHLWRKIGHDHELPPTLCV